jgi:hypothetical protein
VPEYDDDPAGDEIDDTDADGDTAQQDAEAGPQPEDQDPLGLGSIHDEQTLPEDEGKALTTKPRQLPSGAQSTGPERLDTSGPAEEGDPGEGDDSPAAENNSMATEGVLAAYPHLTRAQAQQVVTETERLLREAEMSGLDFGVGYDEVSPWRERLMHKWRQFTHPDDMKARMAPKEPDEPDEPEEPKPKRPRPFRAGPDNDETFESEFGGPESQVLGFFRQAEMSGLDFGEPGAGGHRMPGGSEDQAPTQDPQHMPGEAPAPAEVAGEAAGGDVAAGAASGVGEAADLAAALVL